VSVDRPPVYCRAEGCGRRLTDPVSVSVGMGPVCSKRAGIHVVILDRSAVRVRPVRERHDGVSPDQMVLDLEEAS
jgi:hypothetical protein